VNRLARQWLDSAGMLLILVVLLAALAIMVPNFASPNNLKALLLSVATIGMIASTMLFCLAAGDFDLSVGSMVALGGVVSALVVVRTDNVPLALAAGIASCGVVGLVNGVVIAVVGINALIATLATLQIVRGLALILSDGSSIGVSHPDFMAIGQSTYFGLGSPIWLMIGLFVFFGWLLNRTVFGRNTLAVGGNREAAELAGISVVRTKIAVFTLQGLVCGLAGVVLASRITSGQPNTAVGLELQVISACVLGGVSLTGGIGSMSGVIVGVLIMGSVQNAMNLKNIPTFYQLVATGVILLAAVGFDRVRQKAKGRI
jgi:L-arabinose transport system permease protein